METHSLPQGRWSQRSSIRPGISVEGHPLGCQSIDESRRLSPELLALEADASLPMVVSVPIGKGEDPNSDRLVPCHGATVSPRCWRRASCGFRPVSPEDFRM